MQTYFDIPYSSDSNPRLCVDVFTPDSIPCRAAVVWLHGGGIEGGSRKGVDEVYSLLDYRTIGGTEFLGIKKPVIKAHGSSDATAFSSAIRQAEKAAENNISDELEQGLAVLATKETAE